MATVNRKFRLFRKRNTRIINIDLSDQSNDNGNEINLPLPFSIENRKGRTVDLARASKYTRYVII